MLQALKHTYQAKSKREQSVLLQRRTVSVEP